MFGNYKIELKIFIFLIPAKQVSPIIFRDYPPVREREWLARVKSGRDGDGQPAIIIPFTGYDHCGNWPGKLALPIFELYGPLAADL